MAKPPVMDNSYVQLTFKCADNELVALKRAKKESGALTGKSVVVLKPCDVVERDGTVFMPNTIEMAQLKKSEKGQFKTNVQISSKMNEMDIKRILVETFPFLTNKRFYCAGAADNRTRLEFHGDRRIWDGRLIKQKIKGNSALYIYTDEGSLGKQDSASSKQSTLKRTHDQMTLTMQGECRIVKGGDVSHMTQGGILAQSGMTQNIVSTASQSQSRKPTMNIVDGQAEGRNTIPSKSSLLPQTDLQGMLSSSLTCQLESLNITSAASEQERGQLGQTAAGGCDLAHVPLEATTRQGQGNGVATRVQVIACNSTDQSKQGYVESAEVDQCAGKSGSVSYATDVHQEYSGTSGSDVESRLSDSVVERLSDSGIEGIDNLFVDDTVENICPESGSVKGGFRFLIELREALPDEVKKGVVIFEGVAAVTVDKRNSLLLSGTVPPSQKAGDVTVTVKTDSGQYIGFTVFTYEDDVKEMVKNIVKDDDLQIKFFKEYYRELEKKNLPSDGRKTEALDSSVKMKQKQSLELLQLMIYTAAQTNAQRFIEMVFSTSAGQVIFNYYKDRTPLPEDVARANRHDKLAQYLQDVHTRLSLDKNAHSTVIDWLELVEAVQKQSLTTQDESPVGLDQSDEDDDDSSDYFADAETSSCGSFDDDPEWLEISEKKEPYVHDEISSEVQITSENNDLSMTCSSKASFTKNERIIKGESTKGQTTRDDICFVVKQGSSCLDKERQTGEYSELSSSLSCVADLLEMSCEDLNNENSISKGPCIHGEISNEVQSIGECDDLSRTRSSKASFTKNERIITGESTKGQITRDEISFVVKQGSCLDKGEEREISELSKPQRITSIPELFVMSCEDPGEDNLIISTSRNNMAKQPKGEPCIHDVFSNEVSPVEIILSWCDDLSMTSSKASFTKNGKIVEVKSTKRRTTSEDRAFAMKQGSSCLEKGQEREFSELSRPQKISCLPKLLEMSCEDLNSGDIISTGKVTLKPANAKENDKSRVQSAKDEILSSGSRDLNEKTSKVSVLKDAFEEVSSISAERKEGVESSEHAAKGKHSLQIRQVPSEIIARGPEAKRAYENALRNGKVKVYRGRIMFIGQDRAGKTSLKKHLLGLPFYPEEQSTDGVEVDPSTFEFDVDHTANWKISNEKLTVSHFFDELAKMVAEKLQEEKTNMNQEGQDEKNVKFSAFYKRITSTRSCAGQTRWFNFEKVIKSLVAANIQYLGLKDLRTIVRKVCFIEDEKEMDTMLDFYHDRGIIVKYRNTVILQFQWLIDIFRKLITIRHFNDMKSKHSQLWGKMEITGVLSMELVDHVFSKFCQQSFAKENILHLMEQFGLIAKCALPINGVKYFVPAQLRSQPGRLRYLKPALTDPCPLYPLFPSGFVPHGRFTQIVSPWI